jgi:ParB family chromosome partitioning protein
MKRDALSHQGRSTSPQVGEKLLSVEQVGLDNGDSKNQVLRYIRLTYLIPELLTKVDEGKIAFSPAVEISFLTEDEQRILLDAIELNDCTPSHAQSIRLKKMSQDCVLTKDQIYEIMSEEKPNQQEHLRFRREDFNGYFPKSYTEQQIKKDILKGLELLHRHRQRNRDAR